MKFKKLESGRSMVEMLGVLAIIGVLSVGGIAGYSLSMRRHRANGIVDLASKYALVLYGQCQQKIMDGTADHVTKCSNFPKYTDAGVGALPAGVQSIRPGGIEDPKSDGTDHVKIYAYYNDQKLCQAVASIAGTSCDKGGTNYSTVITIKQN